MHQFHHVLNDVFRLLWFTASGKRTSLPCPENGRIALRGAWHSAKNPTPEDSGFPVGA